MAPSSSGHRAARRRAKSRESLLAVAAEAFHHTPYRDVRIEDLAAAATGPSPLTEQLRESIGNHMAQLVAEFESQIELAIAAGEMHADFDAHLVAQFLWGAWNGVVSLGLRGDKMRLGDDEVAACLRQGTRIVRNGLSVSHCPSTSA
ncbi:TetR family transcriptional regulator C-terminal domain-containing protein [Mycolicibacterium helvum]|uniref:TetR family transcriptional regulator C-terminal domain-containing protein n=1 Tax=Mycolicibacterium helvum TaxID=1534349 RepID=UPI0013D390B4|nr:hypothetical protein [Mycolicibacterium helvum]